MIPAAAINKKKGKDPLERYYTKFGDARRCWDILAKLRLCAVQKVFDPSCGDSVFIDACYDTAPPGVTILYEGYDIDRQVRESKSAYSRVQAGRSYLDMSTPKGVTHIVTNPPFSLADKFVEKARTEAPDAVLGLLLPMSYFGSQDRTASVHRHHRPTYAIHMGRLKFGGPAMAGKKKGSAAMDYAFAIWAGENTGFVKWAWESHLCAPCPLFEGV